MPGALLRRLSTTLPTMASLSIRGLLCAIAVVAIALVSPATIATGATSEAHVNFRQAKRALARFARMTCPHADCLSRVHSCRRRSERRVDCRSEVLINNQGSESAEEEGQAIPNELCTWLGVATPARPRGTGLRVEARGFACRATEATTLPPRG